MKKRPEKTHLTATRICSFLTTKTSLTALIKRMVAPDYRARVLRDELIERGLGVKGPEK